MRRFLVFAPVLALVACGGGGGTPISPGPTASPAPTPTPTAPASNDIKPTFHLKIPARTSSRAGRKPEFVSSATLSVVITLTADSLSIDPTTLAGNPATTNVNGATGINCTSGCTVSGPPSPLGADTYTITTFDAAGGGGSALDTLVGAQYTISQGVANSESATLLGIPGSISIGAFPATPAGSNTSFTLGDGGTVAVTVADADGETITGQYENPVTIVDPDMNGDGTYVEGSTCPTYPTGNTTTSGPTSATLTSDTSEVTLCYGGIGENPVTITGKSSSAISGTSKFSPALNAPFYVPGSGTPASVVVGSSPPDVQLVATSGVGSTGTASYSESGWTGAPYDQKLIAGPGGACTSGTSFASYATITAGALVSGATPFTVSTIASPTAGACPEAIGDGLTSNASDGTAALDTSYTTSGFTVNGRKR
jgi:hypothetical protein